ncbi:MAG TPA: OsmC family protein [Verrucomicrobiales bacterium]|jgi:hypothetical protein|nr:OsmC family protein [Verrucomicrobiales bacterium]
MADWIQRAPVGVRVTAKSGERVSVFARSHRAVLGKGWSFDIAEPEMTGAELLLGALASDVIGLFFELAKKRRAPVDEVEATVKGELADPLVHLGVIGAEGEPRYSSFTLRAYAGSSAPEELLQEIWREALRRAPLANTLRRAAALEAALQISP